MVRIAVVEDEALSRQSLSIFLCMGVRGRG